MGTLKEELQKAEAEHMKKVIDFIITSTRHKTDDDKVRRTIATSIIRAMGMSRRISKNRAPIEEPRQTDIYKLAAILKDEHVRLGDMDILKARIHEVFRKRDPWSVLDRWKVNWRIPEKVISQLTPEAAKPDTEKKERPTIPENVNNELIYIRDELSLISGYWVDISGRLEQVKGELDRIKKLMVQHTHAVDVVVHGPHKIGDDKPEVIASRTAQILESCHAIEPRKRARKSNKPINVIVRDGIEYRTGINKKTGKVSMKRACSILGCSKYSTASGYCKFHTHTDKLRQKVNA